MLVALFVWTSLVFLFQGVLFPGFVLFSYAPWIGAVLLNRPWVRALWMASGAGLCMDLLSDHPFGIHAIGWTITTASLFRFRHYFLFENVWHWSLLSGLVSFVMTGVIFFLLFLFDRRTLFAGQWFFLDWAVMPLADGLYTLVFCAWPLTWLKWGRYWLKQKRLFPL